MLDYPKLEEYKKGGRVKIINKSIIKKKKMKVVLKQLKFALYLLAKVSGACVFVAMVKT